MESSSREAYAISHPLNHFSIECYVGQFQGDKRMHKKGLDPGLGATFRNDFWAKDQRMSNGKLGKERRGVSFPLVGLFTHPSSQETPSPTWHLWLLTPHCPCPVPCGGDSSTAQAWRVASVLICIWPCLDHFPLRPYWCWQLTGSPPSWEQGMGWHHFPLSLLESPSFQTELCFAPRTIRRARCKVYVRGVVSGCAGNHF